MGGSYHRTAALATAAALLFTTGVKAVGDGIKEAGWKPLCRLTVTLEKAADLAMGQIQQVTAGAKQYTLATLKLQVLAEMETNQTKQIGYSALAVAASARADEAMDLLHTLQNEDIPALFYAGDLRGNIGGVLNLIGDAEKTGSTNYCLADATDTARGADLDTIACGSKYHTVTPKLNKIGRDITPTGFKNVVTTNAITSGGSSDGKFVLTTTPSDATTTFFKTGATRLIMAGTVQITPNDNSGSWQVNGGQPIAESGIARADNLLAKSYNSLQSIQKRDINCCGPATVDDAIKAAADSRKYEETLAAILSKAPHNLKAPQLEKTTAQIKAELTGAAETGMTLLLREIKQKQPKGVYHKGAAASNLEALNSLTELLKALSYYNIERSRQVTNLQKEVADDQTKSPTTSAKTTETEETCKTNGTGDNCKPPCKVVEENGAKNTLDKEEAKKLEEKTEQKDGKMKKTTTKNTNEKKQQKEFEEATCCKSEGKECKYSSFS